MDAMKENLDVDSALAQKAPPYLPPPEEILTLQEDGADPAPETVVDVDCSAEATSPGETTVSRSDDAAAGTISSGAEQGSVGGMFDIDQGLQQNLHADTPRLETYPKVQERGYTLPQYIKAWIVWFFTSRMLSSPGEVHDSVELADDYEINTAHIYLIQETMWPLWIRNVFLGRGWRELDFWPWLLKHDSIVVKIGDENGSKWIKAEKGGESRPLKNDGGIKLKEIRSSRHPEDWKDRGDVAPGRYGVRFDFEVKGEVSFTWRQLKLILSPPEGADYNAFSANCWQYAFSITNDILHWVLINSEDEEVKGEIRQELAKLMPLERHFCNLRANSSSPKSRVTREKFCPDCPLASEIPRCLVRGTQKFMDWR